MKQLIILLICSNALFTFGQSTSANNTWTATPLKYIGFNTTNLTNPLLFRTNDINRMKLNGTVSYGINGYPAAPKNGYMLIGISNNSIFTPANNIYTTNTAGAYSLLHLNGSVNSAVAGLNQYQEFGYRPWMETGLSLTGNRDFAYFGLRPVGNYGTADRTETVFLWADNGAGGSPDSPDGPDNMVFRFSGYGGSDGTGLA